MTTITPSLFTGQYYSLASTSAAAADTPAAPQADSIDSLLNVLSPSPGGENSSLSGNSDLVDLSPEAQSYLAALGMGDPSGAGQDTGSGGGFLLTPQQQQQIGDILAKYKDAPFTQDTYNQIQNDLKAAGLSPDQLALEDQMRTFNPTQILLDALDGVQTDPNAGNFLSNNNEQGNADSYMQQIVSQWQSLSTTAEAAPDAAGGPALPVSA
jgi:hypothetical protein